MHQSTRLRFAALLALTLLAPAATAQFLFEAPWHGYNVGLSNYPGNPTPGLQLKPMAVLAADLDGDGDQDAVTPTWQNFNRYGITVLLNEGDGSFGLPAYFFVPGSPSTIAAALDVTAADFDGDGDLDLAMPLANGPLPSSGSQVAIFYNDGAGAFPDVTTHAAGTRPAAVEAGDFDGDGDADLVVANYSWLDQASTVTLLRGDGAGGFAAPQAFPAGEQPYELASGDLDGDGRLDLVVANEQPQVTVLFGTEGGFAPPVFYPSLFPPQGGFYSTVALGDSDGDGDLDVFFANTRSHPVASSWSYVAHLRNDGNGALVRAPDIQLAKWTAGPVDLAVGDLDGDGDLDLVGEYYSDGTGGGPMIVLNDGTGTFGDLQHFPAGQGTFALTLADLDGDGDLDLLTADDLSLAVTVHKNPGDGHFPVLETLYETGGLSIRLDAADVDGDGDLDVLTSGEGTGALAGLLKNNGDGTFTDPVFYPQDQGSGTSRAKLRDLDGDGYPDLLYTSPDNEPPYHFFTAINDGTGLFGPITTWPHNRCSGGDVDAFDMDGDGDLDVVNLEVAACAGSGLGNRVFISLNNGDGTFQAPWALASNVRPWQLVGGDFDEDGNVDLAVAHRATGAGGGLVSLHLGNGDGTVQEELTFYVGSDPRMLVAADLDGDGHLDLATGNTGNPETMTVLWGTGTGSFTGRQDYYAPYAPGLDGMHGVEAGDVDGDGDLDVMVTTVANSVNVYLNEGNRQFAFADPFRYGMPNGPWDPFFADFTGDGIPDLAAVVSLPPSGLGRALGILPGLAGQPSAPVAVSAQPVGGPITIGPGGGSFQFTVTLTNQTAESQTFQAWTVVSGPVGREPVMGPLSVTLPPGATLTRTLRQQVPRQAPAGAYTYHVRLGTLGGMILASDAFPFAKEGGALAARGADGAPGDWSVSGWDEAQASASAALPDGFALSEARPNPFTREAHLVLEVAAAQQVRVEVYDALGRRVAVLHDGALEAGSRALVLEGTSWPAGVYVVRVAGETFRATRCVTLVR